MNEQQKDIFHTISHDQSVPASRISFLYHISMRETEKLVNEINEELAPNAKIEMTGTKLLTLKVYDRNAFTLYRDELLYGVSEQNSQEFRISRIILKFLDEDCWIKIDDLADSLYVSRRQISKDLVLVRSYLEKNDLKITYLSHYGMKIEGDEIRKRVLIAHLLTSHLKEYAKLDFSTMRQKEVFTLIRSTITDVFQKHQVRISDYYFTSLAIHIYVSIRRIRGGFVMPEKEISYPFGRQAIRIAGEIMNSLGEQLDFQAPHSEIGYLAGHLHAKSSSFRISSAEDAETQAMIRRFLRRIDSHFQTEFSADAGLGTRLLLHFIPLRTRLHYGYQMRNMILPEIRQKHLFEMMIAEDSLEVLEEGMHASLSEHETGFVALNLALSYREQIRRKAKHILLVCGVSHTESELLKKQISEGTGIPADQIDEMSRWQFSSADPDSYSCILTTVPLYVNVNVPVYRIGSYLTDQDLDALNSALDDIRENYLLSTMVRKELYLGQTDYETVEEAVRDMCGRLSGDPGYYEEVMQCAERFSPAAGNSVACFHSLKAGAGQTRACIAVNRSRLKWGRHDVRILLVCEAAYESHEHLYLLMSAVCRLAGNEEAVNDLLRHPDYRTFCEWIY